MLTEREEAEASFNGSHDARYAAVDVINEEHMEEDGDGEVHEDEDEDGEPDASPLLPIFSAAHLDVLPVYDLTHTIRSLVVARCETSSPGTNCDLHKSRSFLSSQFSNKSAPHISLKQPRMP